MLQRGKPIPATPVISPHRRSGVSCVSTLWIVGTINNINHALHSVTQRDTTMCAAFSKQDIFPVIGEIIDAELMVKDSINRDEIATRLIDHPKTTKIIINAAVHSNTNDLFNIAGNMVDWFSAEITKRSNISFPWTNKYYRTRTKVNNRYIWSYFLNSTQSVDKQVRQSLHDKKARSNVPVEDAEFQRAVRFALLDKPEARRKRLENARVIPKKIEFVSISFIRNPDVVAEVLSRANGHCEYCQNPAPFVRRADKSPYLEVHHIKMLSEGGEDTVANAVALCPNCHRKVHYA